MQFRHVIATLAAASSVAAAPAPKANPILPDIDLKADKQLLDGPGWEKRAEQILPDIDLDKQLLDGPGWKKRAEQILPDIDLDKQFLDGPGFRKRDADADPILPDIDLAEDNQLLDGPGFEKRDKQVVDGPGLQKRARQWWPGGINAGVNFNNRWLGGAGLAGNNWWWRNRNFGFNNFGVGLHAGYGGRGWGRGWRCGGWC